MKNHSSFLIPVSIEFPVYSFTSALNELKKKSLGMLFSYFHRDLQLPKKIAQVLSSTTNRSYAEVSSQ